MKTTEKAHASAVSIMAYRSGDGFVGGGESLIVEDDIADDRHLSGNRAKRP